MASIGVLIDERARELADWRGRREGERQEAYELQAAQLEKIMKCPQEYADFLRMQGNIPHFSVGNIALVLAQNKSAKNVRTFEAWSKLGRSVKKGEKGIRIFVPEKYAYTKIIEETGYYGDVREVEEYREGMGFRLERVFDMSQTTGRMVKTVPVLAEGSGHIKAALKCLLMLSPVTVCTDEGVDGAYYDRDAKKIWINPSLSDSEAFSQLSREIVAAENAETYEYCPYADDVSRVLRYRFGVEAESRGAGYFPENRDLKQLQSWLGEIRRIAYKMGESIHESVVRHGQEEAAL